MLPSQISCQDSFKVLEFPFWKEMDCILFFRDSLEVYANIIRNFSISPSWFHCAGPDQNSRVIPLTTPLPSAPSILPPHLTQVTFQTGKPKMHNSNFTTFPIEILQDIHIRSANLSLQHVCQRFYGILGTRYSRLRFCAHILCRRRAKVVDYLECLHFRPAQIEMLQQTWFTGDFASELEAETLRLQQKIAQRHVNMVRK